MVSLNDVRSGKCTRDLLERLPIGHNRTTNQRTNARAKKGKSEDRVRKGGGPAGRAAPEGRRPEVAPSTTRPTLWGRFRVERRGRWRRVGGPRALHLTTNVTSPFDLRSAGRKYGKLLCKLFAPSPAIFLTPAVTDNRRITRDLRLTVLVLRWLRRSA